MEKSHWNGKVWYAYGTSITSVKWGTYAPYLEKISGMQLKNCGIPGGGLTNLGGCSKGEVKAALMSLEDGKAEADLITLEVGANEGGAHGYKYDLGDDTLCGCLNQCLRYLQENTNAQIVVFPSVPTIYEPSTAKEYHDRIEKIREVCEINRVRFIDAGTGIGYARIARDKMYTHDQIHQTDLGGYNYARYIWSHLKNIPLWYTEIPEEDKL